MSIARGDLAGLDFRDVATGERMPPITPGDILRTEFLGPLGLSARALARDLDEPPNRITEIVNGARAITAASAILFGERFGTTAEFWMNLQTAHDLAVAGKRRAA